MKRLNLNYLINQLIPFVLRRPKMVSWLLACLKPLEPLNDSFQQFAEETPINATYNGQTIILQYALNWIFGTPQGTIWIENVNNTLTTTYIFTNAESQPERYIYLASEAAVPTHIYQNQEFSTSEDFIVHIPTAMASFQGFVRIVVDRIKIAGTYYIVNTY